MDKKCIVIFLTDDIAQTYDGRPLMLQDALFCPVLNWCMRAWTEKGIGRFFVVCDPDITLPASRFYHDILYFDSFRTSSLLHIVTCFGRYCNSPPS